MKIVNHLIQFLSLVGVLILSFTTLRAEGIEIAPFYGLRTGQNFYDRMSNQSIDLHSSSSYGATVDVPLMRHGKFLELLYSHQESRLTGNGLFPTIDTRIEQWQGGILQEYNYEPWKPFLVGLLGVTHFDFSSGYGTKDLFSVGLGGGIKYFPAPHIGFRLDARGFVSFVDGSGGIACSGGCVASYTGDIFWQFEVAPSVVVAF